MKKYATIIGSLAIGLSSLACEPRTQYCTCPTRSIQKIFSKGSNSSGVIYSEYDLGDCRSLEGVTDEATHMCMGRTATPIEELKSPVQNWMYTKPDLTILESPIETERPAKDNLGADSGVTNCVYKFGVCR